MSDAMRAALARLVAAVERKGWSGVEDQEMGTAVRAAQAALGAEADSDDLDALIPLKYDADAKVFVTMIPGAPMSQGNTRETARRAAISAMVLALDAYRGAQADLRARLAACEEERAQELVSDAACADAAELEIARLGHALDASVEERETVRTTLAAVEAERDAWKNAIIDAAIVSWTYRKKHEDDPRAAVNALLTWTSQVALDPTVSEPASRLHARIATLEAAQAQCANLCRCGCHA